MRRRRVVTGLDAEGRAVVVDDGPSPRVLTDPEKPGLAVIDMWATHQAMPSLPQPEVDPILEGWSYWPAPGNTLFRLVRLPPAGEIEEALDAGLEVAPVSREYLMKSRGVQAYDYQDLGMHATETIDYAVVISGEAWMELGGGETVHLQAGDCLVQKGTAHNWFNKGDEPCLIAFVLLGAKLVQDGNTT